MTVTDEKALDICRRAIRALQLKYSHIPEDVESVSEAVEHIAESAYEISEIEIMVQAIEKQIPKKGHMVGDEYSSHLCCPTCNLPIINVWNKADYKPNYCHFCGQHLDWGSRGTEK